MYAKKNSGKKVAAMLLAVVLLIGVGVGGTLAWLSATSGTVTNTFTVGDVNIELKEHNLKDDGALDENTEVTEENTYKIVPGDTQPKDPFVRVKANSEDSWIFVQVKEVNNTVTGNDNAPKYVDWAIAEGWAQLGNTENGVSTYYRTSNYTTKNTDEIYYVLSGNEGNANGIVTYAQDLTKANLAALDKDAEKTEGHGSIETDEMPKLIFKAFAVQKEAADTASDAWKQVPSAEHLGATTTP